MTASPRFFTDPLGGSLFSFGQKWTSTAANAYLVGLRAHDLAIERAIAENWPETFTEVVPEETAVCWSEAAGLWIIGRQDASTPANPHVVRGTRINALYNATTQPPAGTGGVTVKGLSAYGQYVSMCGTPGAANNQKYRWSDNYGDTWVIAGSSYSDANSVDVVEWFASAGLFVSGGALGRIETSPTGATWTPRTPANTNAISSMASSGSVIVGVSSASTNKCVVSANGIDWVERTLPYTIPWFGVTHLASQGYWLAVGYDSPTLYLAKSADAVTWTGVSHAGFFPSVQNPKKLVSTGNIAALLCNSFYNAVWLTEDVGSNWRMAACLRETSSPSTLAVATRSGLPCQLLATGVFATDVYRYASIIA
jgi:hypothetical protein